MKRLNAISLTLALCACSTQQQKQQSVAMPQPVSTPSTAVVEAAPNPFLTPSPLPFQAPLFDRIKDTDYRPAIEEGMKEQIAEIDKIANDTGAPTFDNTIVAMDHTGVLLARVAKVFFNMTQSNTNPTLQKIEEELSPRLAA